MNPRKAALTLWALDTAERVVKSFLVGWLGAWLAIQDQRVEQLFAAETLTAGVAAAALSLTLALGARQIGSAASASWLPGVVPEIPEDVQLTHGNVAAFDGGQLEARRPIPRPGLTDPPIR